MWIRVISGDEMEIEPLDMLQHLASELGFGPLDGSKTTAEQYSEFLLRIGEQIEFGSKDQKHLALRAFWTGFLHLFDKENCDDCIVTDRRLTRPT